MNAFLAIFAALGLLVLAGAAWYIDQHGSYGESGDTSFFQVSE